MRTTFYNADNEEILDPKLIMKNYLYSANFAIDLLSAFPISEVYSGSNQSVIRILYPIPISISISQAT